MEQTEYPDLSDPYKYAPPKPDGDPWAILLKPEMEADKIQCNVWKEEVQTLLIFAGLFSAVVTAFVIESYKFLSPDPNDSIIGLLNQIANAGNSSLLPSSVSPVTSPSTRFSQTASSIRINVFWFLSLILSLTTVLIGTIALQWLREHQSYPVFSPKETLAILHMRRESLKAWHVPQIFSSLPLLLQSALVLFLAGLIDFVLPLGMKLAIPIACVIGLNISFLIATTALPALQALALLSGHFSRRFVPSPCAFKSPQSQVLRTLSGFVLDICTFVLDKLHIRKRLTEEYNFPEKQRHLFPHIQNIFIRKMWSDLDREWLFLRDAWHHGIFDQDVGLSELRRYWNNIFPLSDITRCLVNIVLEDSSAKHTEEFLIAACYCFQEISESVWKPIHPDFRVDRFNHYFEQLHRHNAEVASKFKHRSFRKGSITQFLIHGGTYNGNKFLENYDISEHYFLWKHQRLFFYEQTCVFLEMLLCHRNSRTLECYVLEMKSRIIAYLLHGKVEPLRTLTSMRDKNALHILDLNCIIRARRDPLVRNCFNTMDIVDRILRTAAFFAIRQSNPPNPLYTHAVMPELLRVLGEELIYFLQDFPEHENAAALDFPNQLELYIAAGSRYSAILHLVASKLNEEISAPEESTPSLLFYLSTLFLCPILYRMRKNKILKTPEIMELLLRLTELLDTLMAYKNRIGGRKNVEIEVQFAMREDTQFINPNSDGDSGKLFPDRFSDTWWTAFFASYKNSGLQPDITASQQSGPFDSDMVHVLPSSGSLTDPTAADNSNGAILPHPTKPSAETRLTRPQIDNPSIEVPPMLPISSDVALIGNIEAEDTGPPAAEAPTRSSCETTPVIVNPVENQARSIDDPNVEEVRPTTIPSALNNESHLKNLQLTRIGDSVVEMHNFKVEGNESMVEE